MHNFQLKIIFLILITKYKKFPNIRKINTYNKIPYVKQIYHIYFNSIKNPILISCSIFFTMKYCILIIYKKINIIDENIKLNKYNKCAEQFQNH